MSEENISTLAANMRFAIKRNEGATIGGGLFSPVELKDGADALGSYPDLVRALEWALGQVKEEGLASNQKVQLETALFTLAKAQKVAS